MKTHTLITYSQTLTKTTTLYFGLEALGAVAQGISKRGVILADARAAQAHGQALQKRLGYELIEVPHAKTREAKEAVEDALMQRHLGRDTVLVALGGGVTTDLVGFVASTYLRGVPLILIPTTLLGMVDAAIGGKTGVDTPFGKNSIGSFYLPEALFIEPSFLATLSEREMKNGLSEILKYGLTLNKDLWEEKELSFLIRASIECKLGVIQQDFLETGFRRVLNFGHTVGHALEFLSGYKMPHGEAVALGCMAESALSHFLGYLSRQDLEIILSRYQELGYHFPRIDPKAFQKALLQDKKAAKGEIRFVLIDRIGHTLDFEGAYCRPVPPKEIERLTEWMHHDSRSH